MPILRSPLRSPIRSSVYNALVGPWGASQFTLNSFQYFIDFTIPSARGGFQTYGNNTNDGRLLRDPTNTSAAFCPNQAGLLVATASSGIRRTDKGAVAYAPFGGNIMTLNNRDFTNASWTKTNMTAARSTGADGVANSGSRLTATAGNATAAQAITQAANNIMWQIDMKRVTGTGQILISFDGGTTTKDVTAQINSGGYSLVFQSANVTNPTAWIQIVTSGDVIDLDFAMLAIINSSLSVASPIPSQVRFATAGVTLFNSQSRPNIDVADAGPLGALEQGYFSFFWQGSSERTASTGFIITGSTGLFLQIQTDGSVKATANAGNATTPAGVFNFGLGSVNKVAFGFDASGTIIVSCNGQHGTGTGASAIVALAHSDLGTNGAGQNTIMGFQQQVAWHPNILLSAADYDKLTT